METGKLNFGHRFSCGIKHFVNPYLVLQLEEPGFFFFFKFNSVFVIVSVLENLQYFRFHHKRYNSTKSLGIYTIYVSLFEA